jgi:pantetheine-phosphate adenylyltransferase
MKTRIAIYPGTFDPITLGHLDIIARAARVVDHLIVAVAENAGKKPFFTLDERIKLVAAEVKTIKKPAAKITVKSFDNLLIDFVRQQKAQLVVRGLRAVSDFEYEFQLAGMNATMAPDIETAFLMASDRYQAISSRFVKEIAQLGGDVRPFVGPATQKALQAKIGKKRA